VVFLSLQLQGRRQSVEGLLQVAEEAADGQRAFRSLLSASSALRELTLLVKYTLPGMLPSLATTSDSWQRLVCKHYRNWGVAQHKSPHGLYHGRIADWVAMPEG